VNIVSQGIVGGPSEKSWRSYFGTRYIVDGAKYAQMQVSLAVLVRKVGGPTYFGTRYIVDGAKYLGMQVCCKICGLSTSLLETLHFRTEQFLGESVDHRCLALKVKYWKEK
jgi:hypothetical protein